MNFGALSRGFGTCCLRFTNGVATIHAKLASGWLAHLYREGVEPSGSLQKVSDHPSSFSGLCLAQGKFHPVASQKYRFPEMPNDAPDLFSLDVRGFEDRPPLLDLGAVVGRERLRILILARRNFLAEIGEPLAHAGIG